MSQGKTFSSHTSGLIAPESEELNVSPTGPSIAQYFAGKSHLKWSSGYNLNTGGWLCPRLSVLDMDIQGGAVLDKALGHMVQVNIAPGSVGTINALVFVEAVLSSIPAGVTVGSLCLYYGPNLAGVPNIGNVTQYYWAANDYTEGHFKTAGKVMNAALVEFSPPHHVGLIAGRYYTAPHDTVAANTVAANVVYLVPQLVPERKTIAKLWFQCTSAIAASNARMALFRAKAGQCAELIIDAGAVSTATTGLKELTVNQRVDAGTYFVAINCSHAIGINWHSGGLASRVAMFGSSSPSLTGGTLEALAYISYAYGPYPANAGALSFSAQQAEPHIGYVA